MARRASTPPKIHGFSADRLIGVGGYADVFLYRQEMPSRDVAVKVLVPDALSGETQRRQFTAEANLMARVSTHPYIVSVFQAAIAADGRPYIVMEYYPGANYLERVRRERFSVADTLRTGIQIASAVETAHRAGILHRDIKPANILTSEYGRPGLTDFGIATPDEHDGDDQEGLSIPWAPPEAFGNARLDERADVYSLAATVYHLLAGRSPFEIAGRTLSQLELMNRIEREPVPLTGRPDVPVALERVLARSMAKDPRQRPATAAELGRLLQGVESELKLPLTQLELAGEHTARPLEDPDAEDATRIRGVTSIDAQTSIERPRDDRAIQSGPPISTVPAQPAGTYRPEERRREGLLAEPEVDETIARPALVAVAGADSERTTPRTWIVAGVVAIVLVAVGAVVALRGGGQAESEDTVPIMVNDGIDDDAAAVVAPGIVRDPVGTANADGTFTFSWTAPDSAATDLAYQVTEQAMDGRERLTHPPQAATTFVADVKCVDIVAIASSIASPSVEACA